MTQSDLLKPLVDAIETAKKRINLYRGSLREDETRTRVALIDPVLRALGWDVSDPRMVTPEYNVRGHKPDYGLHKPVDDPNDEETVGNLVAILEAKRLEERLQNHYTQMTEDAENARLNYAGITDGDNWELYRFVGGGLRKEWTPVMQVRLTDVPTYAAAIKLLVLWRPNLASGQLLEAETSIVGPPTPDDPPTPNPDETNEDWVPLPTFNANISRLPRRIKFPDRTVRDLSSWRSIIDATAQWLFDSGRLTPENVPLRYGARGGMINTTPIRPNGKNMNPVYQVPSQEIYVDAHGRRDTIVQRALVILGALSVDPSDVYVEPR